MRDVPNGVSLILRFEGEMRILQVIPYFIPALGYGGPLTVVYNLSKELVERGHQVVVYTTDTLSARNRIRETEETIDGIKVKRFRNLSNFLAYKHNLFLSPGMLFTIKKELPSFDIIHIYEYRTLQNVLVHHYAKDYNIPYVSGADGSLVTGFRKQRLKKTFDRFFGHRIIRDASKLIAITPTEVEQYRELGVEESKIVHIPNSIDISEYEPLPEKGAFRKKCGITEENIILFLGRIHKIKGLDILVEAVAALIKEGRSIRLVIAGPDYGYLDYLKKLAKKLRIDDRITFTGFIFGEMKLAAYVDADVYVLPSIYETFPITVLEACACATPVIVTDRCQIADLVRDNVGFVVPCDKDRLRDAILNMLTDKELRVKFGERGRVLVRERYTSSHRTEQIEAIYKKVLAGVK